MSGTLYIVGTPIGNLEDITQRALRVLKECDVVLCEDTRVTKKLLRHYGFEKTTLSYHEHSKEDKYNKIFSLLEEGGVLALVSDAGTPGISDPGARLVRAVRRDLPETHIEAIPGPSALTTALSVGGVGGDTFTFYGFPPHKKGRETFFDALLKEGTTAVFYESPHRIIKALSALAKRAEYVEEVTVARELTKIYEEVVQGTAEEVLLYFTEHSEKVRGEFVVIVTMRS